MPNDAKLGFIAGLIAVVVVAVVYHSKPPSNAGSHGDVAAYVGTENDPPLIPPAAVTVPPRPPKDVQLGK